MYVYLPLYRPGGKLSRVCVNIFLYFFGAARIAYRSRGRPERSEDKRRRDSANLTVRIQNVSGSPAGRAARVLFPRGFKRRARRQGKASNRERRCKNVIA